MGVFICAECLCEVTEALIKKQYKASYGLKWEQEWSKLRAFRLKVRRNNKFFRSMGHRMAEAIYTLEPLDPVEHSKCIQDELESVKKVKLAMKKYMDGEIDVEPLYCSLLPEIPHHTK